jgi:hypothetical protein
MAGIAGIGLMLQMQRPDGRPFASGEWFDATRQYAHDDIAFFTIFLQAIH